MRRADGAASGPARTSSTTAAFPRTSTAAPSLVYDHGGAMQVVGNEANHHRERRQDAPRRQGVRRGAQHPLASPNVRTLGRLAHDGSSPDKSRVDERARSRCQGRSPEERGRPVSAAP